MNLSKIRIRDLFLPARWRSVLIYFLKRFLWIFDEDSKIEIHIIEQYMFRLLQCPKCVAAGSCEHCGCAIPERMWVKTDHCSNYMWGPFMSKEAWEKHKKTYNLQFSVTYESRTK